MKILIRILIIPGVVMIFSLPSRADGYWGYDVQGASTYTLNPSYCWGNRYSVDFFSPSNAVIIDTLIVWCNGQNNSPKLVFGIYDVMGGVIGNKIAVSDTLAITGNTMQRWASESDLSLQSGSTYTLCIDVTSAIGPVAAYTALSGALSRYAGTVFPSNWFDSYQLGARYGVAAHYRNNMAGGVRRRIILGGDK